MADEDPIAPHRPRGTAPAAASDSRSTALTVRPSYSARVEVFSASVPSSSIAVPASVAAFSSAFSRVANDLVAGLSGGA